MTDDDVKRVALRIVKADPMLAELLTSDDLDDIARAAMAETLRMAGERLRGCDEEGDYDFGPGISWAADWLNAQAQEVERD